MPFPVAIGRQHGGGRNRPAAKGGGSTEEAATAAAREGPQQHGREGPAARRRQERPAGKGGPCRWRSRAPPRRTGTGSAAATDSGWCQLCAGGSFCDTSHLPLVCVSIWTAVATDSGGWRYQHHGQHRAVGAAGWPFQIISFPTTLNQHNKPSMVLWLVNSTCPAVRAVRGRNVAGTVVLLMAG